MLAKNNCDVNLFPAMVNTKTGTFYGYINPTGNFHIEPKYNQAADFTSNGTALVSENNLWGIINPLGDYILKPTYDYINPFKDRRAIVTKNNAMGVINEEGKIIPTKNYTFIGDYSDGLALVAINMDNGNYFYGYINKNGTEVIPTIYKMATSFENGFALVQTTEDIYKIINKNNETRTTFPYKIMGNFKDNLLTFSESYDSLIGYVDIDGNVIIPPKFTLASPVEDGYIIASTSTDYINNYGVIDLNNSLIYPFIYNYIKYLGNNRFALGIPRGDEYTFMNSIYALGTEKGVILTKFAFKSIDNFEEKIASVSNLRDTYFIDELGRRVEGLPTVEGTGTIAVKCDLIYADVDYWPMYLNPEGDIIYEADPVITLSDQYSVVKVKYKPNVNYLVYYPEVLGVYPEKLELLINTKLKALSDLEKVKESDILYYNKYGDFNVLFFKKNLFIPEINIYTYPFGAAHGMTIRKTPNINLKTGEFYTLSDLFMGGIYWTKYINDIITDMIKTDPQYDYVYPDSFKGITENQDFYVDENNLYIYYPPYDIGPYAAGFITFKIPFSEIDNLINKNGSFYRSFN